MTLRNRIHFFIIPALASCSSGTDGVKPEIKPLVEAVYASGFVVAKNEYEIISQVEGTVSVKLVRDGDEVKKGDPLFVISSDQQSARYRMAQDAFDLARQNHEEGSPVLQELKAAVDASHARMLFDSANFTRYQNLIRENATSQTEFDRVKLAFDNSRKEYLLHASRYEKMKNQLTLEYVNARNNLLIASDESERYIIRSQVDGLVFLTRRDKGELIRRNEVVAVVGNKNDFYLELMIDELDVQRVKVDQVVLVKIDAYPDKIFEARITRLFPMVDRRQQSVQADAELTQPLPGIFSGLAVEANIIVRQKPDALVIPKSRLLPGDSVRVITEDGETEMIKVTTGMETLDEVEILEGLDTGKLIVLK